MMSGCKRIILTCDPSVRSLDCNRRAKASARPRQDIPSGMKEVIPQGRSLLADSSGAFIYLSQLAVGRPQPGEELVHTANNARDACTNQLIIERSLKEKKQMHDKL